jgi:hypothetical protein
MPSDVSDYDLSPMSKVAQIRCHENEIDNRFPLMSLQVLLLDFMQATRKHAIPLAITLKAFCRIASSVSHLKTANIAQKCIL